MKQAGVYTILNLVTGRCYVGSSINVANRWACHLSTLNKGKHSSASLQADWEHYGPDAFAWSLVESCSTRAEAIQREQAHIDRTPDLYNAARRAGSGPPDGFKQTDVTKAKMRAAMTGRIVTWGAKVSATKKGKPHSGVQRVAHAAAMADPNVRAKMRAGMKGAHAPQWSALKRERWLARQAAGGFTHTAESKAKMSASMVASRAARQQVMKKHTPETRLKMSAAQKGRIITAEARAKISATRIARGIVMSAASREKWRATRAGYRHSEETKAKMSAAWIRRRAQKESA